MHQKSNQSFYLYGANGAKVGTRGIAQPTQQKKQSKNSQQTNTKNEADLRIRVKSTELEALRNYNAQINSKLKESDNLIDTKTVDDKQPHFFAKNTFGQVNQQQIDDCLNSKQTFNPAEAGHQETADKPQGQFENNQLIQDSKINLKIGDAVGPSQQNQSWVEANNIQYRHPISSVVNPGQSIYKYGQDRDKHQHAIIGSSSLAAQQLSSDPESLLQEKELKQKEYQIELQRQIQERDFIRKKEEYKKTKGFDIGQQNNQSLNPLISQPYADPKRRQPSEMPYQQSESPKNKNILQRSLSGRDKYSQQKQQFEQTSNFNGSGKNQLETLNQQNQYQQFDPSRTKFDFPDIKTRGKVLENRTDLELERQGNILTLGRDEKTIFQSKREQEQATMRLALQQQIEEKQRKKEIEKEKSRQHELRDDQRVRDEMKQMAIAEGINPQQTQNENLLSSNDLESSLNIKKETSYPLNPNLMASHGANSQNCGTIHGSRRTAYAANQHSVSIIGSDIGHQYLPENLHHIAKTNVEPVSQKAGDGQINNQTQNVDSNSPRQLNNKVISRIKEAQSPNNLNNSQFKENKNERSLNANKVLSEQSPVARNTANQIAGFDSLERDYNNVDSYQNVGIVNDNAHQRELEDHKEKQINELSDMVKELLKEQKELKYQLDANNQQQKKHQSHYNPSKYAGPIKRASERVPRSNNPKLQSKDPFGVTDLNNDLDLENPRNYLNIGLSGKPNAGDPQSNIRLNVERKKVAELRRKQQQDKDKEKIDAIEAKIENARRRLEEKKKIKSDNARNTVKRRTAPNSSQYYQQLYKNEAEWEEEGAIGSREVREPGLYISSKSQHQGPRFSNISEHQRINKQQSKLNVQRSITINQKGPNGSQSVTKTTEPKSKKRVQLNLLNNHSSSNSLKQAHQRPPHNKSSHLAMMQIDSPGKFSHKPVNFEKELDHESQLIPNQINSHQPNQVAGSQYAKLNNQPESFNGSYINDNNYINNEAQSEQQQIIGRGSRNHQNIQEPTGLSVSQHKAQMLSQQLFIPKYHKTGFKDDGPKSYNFGGKQSNAAFGETSFDMEFMMPPDITSIDSDINKIGALTPSPFLDGTVDQFNLTATNTALNSNFIGNYPSKFQNAPSHTLNQAISQGYRHGDRGSFGAYPAGSLDQKGPIGLGALSAFSGHTTTNDQNKLGGPLITNYVNSQNPAAVTQNAGFQQQAPNNLAMNMTPGLSNASEPYNPNFHAYNLKFNYK